MSQTKVLYHSPSGTRELFVLTTYPDQTADLSADGKTLTVGKCPFSTTLKSGYFSHLPAPAQPESEEDSDSISATDLQDLQNHLLDLESQLRARDQQITNLQAQLADATAKLATSSDKAKK